MSSGNVLSQPLRVAAALVLVLNLLDAIFTIGFVQLGVAEEANPLMALPLSSGGPLLFMLVKLSLVSCCVGLLWRLRAHRTAIAGMYATATVYTMLLAYHLSSANEVANYMAAN